MTILIKKVTIIVSLLFYNNNIYANDNNENSLPVLYLSGNFGKGQRIEKQARDIYIQNRRKFLVR